MSLLGKSSSISIASLMNLINSLPYVTDPEKGISTSLSLLPFSNLCPVERGSKLLCTVGAGFMEGLNSLFVSHEK